MEIRLGGPQVTFSGQAFQRRGWLSMECWSGSSAHTKHCGRSPARPDLYPSAMLPVSAEAWALSKLKPLAPSGLEVAPVR